MSSPSARIHAALKARGLTRLTDLIAQTPIDVAWDDIVKDVLGDEKAMASSTLVAAVLAECPTPSDQDAFVRGWLARRLRPGVPDAGMWVATFTSGLPEPWRSRAADTWIRLRDTTPAGWRPSGPDDPALVAAWKAPPLRRAGPEARSPRESEPSVRVGCLFSSHPTWEAVDQHLRRAGWSTTKITGALDMRVQPWFTGGYYGVDLLDRRGSVLPLARRVAATIGHTVHVLEIEVGEAHADDGGDRYHSGSVEPYSVGADGEDIDAGFELEDEIVSHGDNWETARAELFYTAETMLNQLPTPPPTTFDREVPPQTTWWSPSGSFLAPDGEPLPVGPTRLRIGTTTFEGVETSVILAAARDALDKAVPAPDLSRWHDRLLRRHRLDAIPSPADAVYWADFASLSRGDRATTSKTRGLVPRFKLTSSGTWVLDAEERKTLATLLACKNPSGFTPSADQRAVLDRAVAALASADEVEVRG